MFFSSPTAIVLDEHNFIRAALYLLVPFPSGVFWVDILLVLLRPRRGRDLLPPLFAGVCFGYLKRDSFLSEGGQRLPFSFPSADLSGTWNGFFSLMP